VNRDCRIRVFFVVALCCRRTYVFNIVPHVHTDRLLIPPSSAAATAATLGSNSSKRSTREMSAFPNALRMRRSKKTSGVHANETNPLPVSMKRKNHRWPRSLMATNLQPCASPCGIRVSHRRTTKSHTLSYVTRFATLWKKRSSPFKTAGSKRASATQRSCTSRPMRLGLVVCSSPSSTAAPSPRTLTLFTKSCCGTSWRALVAAACSGSCRSTRWRCLPSSSTARSASRTWCSRT